MPLNFVLIGVVALGLYLLTYFFLQRRTNALGALLSKWKEHPRQVSQSFIMRWAFRGRSERQDRLACVFTIFPPLIVILTFWGVFLSFLIAIVFLMVETSFGMLATALLITFPYYHSVDAFEMYAMSRVAQRAGVGKLSDEDGILLDEAWVTLRRTIRYFRKLSISAAIALIAALVFEPFAGRFLVELAPRTAEGLLPFAALSSALLLSTITIPRLSFSQSKSEDTREIALPMAGDHLSYGTLATLEATRSRLMRKFRLEEALEEQESEAPEQPGQNE